MPIYNFNLPDKSRYKELVLTSGEIPRLPTLIYDILQDSAEQDSVRVLTFDQVSDAELVQHAGTHNISLIQRKTNVFMEDLNDLVRSGGGLKGVEVIEIPKDSIMVHENDIQCQTSTLPLRVLPPAGESSSNILRLPYAQIYLEFMLGSFGVDFVEQADMITVVKNQSKYDLLLSRFEIAYLDPQNKHYLVLKDGKYVGAFCLVFLPEIGQIQLHSVAGRAGVENSYDGKGKISLLLRAVVELLDRYVGQYDQLLFTCSKPKIAKLYQDFGLQLATDINIFNISYMR
jgi:hypothetical protein